MNDIIYGFTYLPRLVLFFLGVAFNWLLLFIFYSIVDGRRK